MKRKYSFLLAIFAIAVLGAFPLVVAADDAASRLVAQEDGDDFGDGSSDFDINVDSPEFDEEQLNEDLDKAAAAAAAAAATFSMVMMVVGFICFAIAIWLMISNYTAAASIPAEHQQVNPGFVFLFLIPCVNLVMYFIVWPGIARGFQSYFTSQGRTDVGDCGGGLAMGTAICMILLGPIGLILWIVLTLKFNGYKKEIQAG